MIPKIEIANSGLKLSRMVCGTNNFVGISHFTESRDMYLREIFKDPAKIAEIIGYCFEEFGVNCCVSSPRDDLYAAIQMVEKEYGEEYNWICTPSNTRETAKETKHGIEGQVDWCAEHNVKICMPHRSYTDARLNTEINEIVGLKDTLAHIRDKGMLTGISTHYYESIRVCNVQNYDVDLIIQPLNVMGFQSNIEVNTLIRKIQNCKTQILAIKTMAAGRLLPEVGIPFAYNNIKSNDLVAVGYDCIENADYDCQLVERLLNK